MRWSIISLAAFNVILLVAAVFVMRSVLTEPAYVTVGGGGHGLLVRPTLDPCQSALQLKKEYSNSIGSNLLLVPTAEAQVRLFC
jgi:hypothetical protein